MWRVAATAIAAACGAYGAYHLLREFKLYRASLRPRRKAPVSEELPWLRPFRSFEADLTLKERQELVAIACRAGLCTGISYKKVRWLREWMGGAPVADPVDDDDAAFVLAIPAYPSSEPVPHDDIGQCRVMCDDIGCDPALAGFRMVIVNEHEDTINALFRV